VTERRTTGSAARATWLLVAGAWCVYGVAASVLQDVATATIGRHMPAWRGFVVQMPLAATWALLTPAIVALARRFPLGRATWLRHGAVHLLGSAVAVVVVDAVGSLVWPLLPGDIVAPLPFTTRLGRLVVLWYASDSLLYWTVVAVAHVRAAVRRAAERELRASQLEGQLAQARLSALQMQLHPHFLFNALNTVGALVRTGDGDAAVTVVARLGDFLRRVLDGAGTQLVPLERELELVTGYLDIERIRFGERLRVRVDASPEARRAAVPQLIVQPLVENAVRHGIAPTAGSGLVEISGAVRDGMLHLVVRDDGPGAAADRDRAGAGEGIGLSNVRLRLTQLFGETAAVRAGNAPEGGFRVELVMPFRPVAAEPAPALSGEPVEAR
jgi:two-component system LytT family sensor kinase